jgi:superfamily II DNA or RNA helicase
MTSQHVTVLIDNRVRIAREPVRGGVSDEAVLALEREFTYQNPQYGEDRPGEPQEILTWAEEDAQHISFPRGGYRRVVGFLESRGYELDVRDERSSGSNALLHDRYDIPPCSTEPWPFQAEGVEVFLQRENCLVRAGTGSGKTQLAILAMAKIGLPSLVVVNTGGLRDQWVKRIVDCMGLDVTDIGLIGDGVVRLSSITVAMQQTLCKLVRTKPDWLDAFGFVVMDEVQSAAADTAYECVDAFSARYRLGISAHEKRQDKKEFLIYDLFGRVAVDIAPEDVVATGKTHDVEVRIIPTTFRADWYRSAMASGNSFRMRAAFNKLLKMMCQNQERNELIHGIVLEEVQRGNQVLVFSHRREHCIGIDRAIVREGVRSGTMLGSAPDKPQFDRTAAGIRDGSIRVAVGTLKAIGTGIDLPSVSAGVLATPVTNNESLFLQARGRICRASAGKTSAALYALWDPHTGRKAIENLMRWNKGNVVARAGDRWISGREFLDSMRQGRHE